MGLISASIDRENLLLEIVQEPEPDLLAENVTVIVDGDGARQVLNTTQGHNRCKILHPDATFKITQRVFSDPKTATVDQLIVNGVEETVIETKSTGIDFDPADYTVDEVIGFLHEYPEELHNVVAQEQLGKNRRTIVNHGQ